MIMNFLEVFLLLDLLHWDLVASNSAGPPPDACGTLAPQILAHGAPPQTSPVPYEIDLSELPLDENGNISYIPEESYERMYMCSCIPFASLRKNLVL